MYILFDDTITTNQVDNPQWVWDNWSDGIPCLTYAEACRLNRWYYGGQGAIGILISYESAQLRGYIND
jgi:hypothetical protein